MKTTAISSFLLAALLAGVGQAADQAAPATDPAAPGYTPGFMETLGKLESGGPVDLPEATPGKLEVTLSTWRPKNDYRVSLNTGQQVFALSAPEKEGYGRDAELAASMAPGDPNRRFQPDAFRSASLLAFKAKQFDDGLYAAVELAVDRGAGKLGSRRALLADLTTALAAGPVGAGSDEALELLNATTRLDGNAVEVPAAATRFEKEFLAEAFRSKPIGFYTWSQDLFRIFQRDRMLQTKLEPQTAQAFTGVLNGDTALLARYRAALRLPARLTNGFADASLAGDTTELAAGQPTVRKDLALFPPSRAYETDLFKKLFPKNSPVPAGFKLADEMVRRIQSGDLDLQPRDDSGWYDYQTYALEPLVIPDQMPEAKRLRLDDSYKKELVKLFKGLLALTRETHVKQLELSLGVSASFGNEPASPPPVKIVLRLSPQLTQEPLATFYLRRALAYRFVRSVLVESFGDAGLAEMKRLTADGPVSLTLDRELRAMESLFYGAYLHTARELDMAPEKQDGLGLGAAGSLALYRSWEPHADPDIARDIRMMVPVLHDLQRNMTKVWVVMGVTTQPIHVRYSTPPTLESVTDSQGNPIDLARVDFQCTDATFGVAYPVMAEIYVTKILDREEMRALCDQHKTREAILEHLK